ncbi:DUF5367 domain-containing protein [Gracilibacillus saliphilus]|uniref:DUF5367 domain-containing protein n=1 Tax=Gracilibacillus saliphilus TaxID=543890 RepID=UPI0013D02DA2|nr:DUF5367 domain-containing protein [Gracilibacillus saliphilus]
MFFLLWGVLIWLGASAIFRFAGQYFFTSENYTLLIVTYILVIPLILALTLLLYRYKNLDSTEQVKAAILIALPGMLIDAIVLIYFEDIFVNLDPRLDGVFGSWLLFAYSLILLSGFLSRKSSN